MYTRANVIREESSYRHICTFIDFKLTGLRHPLIEDVQTQRLKLVPLRLYLFFIGYLVCLDDQETKVTSSRETD